jgi:hypothetical protein
MIADGVLADHRSKLSCRKLSLGDAYLVLVYTDDVPRCRKSGKCPSSVTTVAAQGNAAILFSIRYKPNKSGHRTALLFDMKHTNAPLALLALGIALSMSGALAANLKPETTAAWDTYVDAARARFHARAPSGRPFLESDEIAGQVARLRSGEIIVSPISANIPTHVSSGLIHDWIGAAFIPNVELTEAMVVLRDYQRYRDIYAPTVIESKAVATSEAEDRFSMVLMNRSLISKTALDSNYKATYTKVNDHRWYSIAETVGIREIANYGTGTQRRLPLDEGTGLIWRMLNFVRFEERDGGVYMEVETIALSRDVPVSLRWVLNPIIRHVSRESLTTSMKQTLDAVQANAFIRTEATLSSAASPEREGSVSARSFR